MHEHYAKYAIGSVVIVGALLFPILTGTFTYREFAQTTAGIFFVDSITEQQLQFDYSLAKSGGNKIRILIVPGHDEVDSGAWFQGLREYDLTIPLGRSLYTLFQNDSSFEPILFRDESGLNPYFANYILDNYQSILAFRHEHKNKMDELIAQGFVTINNNVSHNFAPSYNVTTLYGINKWASENDIDVVIHVHFNDEGGRNARYAGKYSGFAIYIPEKQFSNSNASRALAENVQQQLGIFFPQSNLPKEQVGIIEDQELIAIGSFNTLDAASLVIEYAYIYEPQLSNLNTRSIILEELAMQTYIGIKNFFENDSNIETATLPYRWTKTLNHGLKYNADVTALQIALASSGLYPPNNRSRNDCPITGNYGSCTQTAVAQFQSLQNLTPALGIVGPFTIEKLNKIYSEPN